MITLRNIGKLNIKSDIGDGIGRRIANDFLNKLFEGFARQSSVYIKAIGEAPFAYRERQLHSIFAPALARFTTAFLMEHPLSRQWSKAKKLEHIDYTGWLDYWCRYRDFDFFIEIKHDYSALN